MLHEPANTNGDAILRATWRTSKAFAVDFIWEARCAASFCLPAYEFTGWSVLDCWMGGCRCLIMGEIQIFAQGDWISFEFAGGEFGEVT